MPGSTLKGIFRTLTLFVNKNLDNKDYIQEAERLENIDNRHLKKDFAFIWIEDVYLNNYDAVIQQISVRSYKSKKSLPLVFETIIWWDFEINVVFDEGNFSKEQLINDIKTYSQVLINREEKILS